MAFSEDGRGFSCWWILGRISINLGGTLGKEYIKSILNF